MTYLSLPPSFASQNPPPSSDGGKERASDFKIPLSFSKSDLGSLEKELSSVARLRIERVYIR